MIAGLILIPFIIGIAALLLKNISKYLLFAGAVFHALLTIFCWFKQPLPMLGGWLGIDSVGMLFLSITSLLFFVVSIYSLSYLEDESEEEKADILGVPSKSLFVACQLFFLSAMTLVITSQHLVVMWIAIEATTLASAPLIFFHRNPRSLEATWKYLLICSVGIALALLGNFFLGISASTNNKQISLVLNDLLSNASQLDPEWLKAAFILIVVGYGTKMGLAPLHTWLPDAHSESPSPVSALLSGALLNCAFLGIFRIYQICNKAGMTTLTSDVLIAFGLFSLAVSAIFILGQNDYKRLLAYSSVEHMGLLALGIGFGASGVFGSMLHTLNHSITKATLFLLAGVILLNYRSKKINEVRGILFNSKSLGILWLLGFLSISGSPPFGIFVSELTIIKAGFEQGRHIIAIITLVLLSFIFIGMATAFLNMTNGKTPTEKPLKLKPAMIYPPVVLLICSLILGFYIPLPLKEIIKNIANY